MTKEEIREYVENCPYSDKSIDSIHTCDLEFHYRKICPSPECLCAEKFGLITADYDLTIEEINEIINDVNIANEYKIDDEYDPIAEEIFDEMISDVYGSTDLFWETRI